MKKTILKQDKLTRIALLLLIFAMFLPFAHATYIDGFSQMRIAGDLSLNSTTLNIFTSNASRVYITQAGMVGIGTALPQQKLTLMNASNLSVEMAVPAGIANITTNATNGLRSGTYYYKITALDGSGETIASDEVSVGLNGLGNNASNVSWRAVTGASSYRVYNASSSGGQASYFTVTDTNFTHTNQSFSGEKTAPTITTAYVNKISAKGNSWILGGNVGIGTTAPTVPFHVESATGHMLVKSSTGTNAAYYRAQNTGGTAYIGVENSAGNALTVGGTAYALALVGPTADVPIQLATGTGNAVRMTILGTGSVGIGTTSPQNKLEVIGAATFAGGVNASSLNVTGFSITDDSLVTIIEFNEEENKENGSHSQAIEPGQYPIPHKDSSIKQYLFKYLSVDESALTELGSHSQAIAPDLGSGFSQGQSNASELVRTRSQLTGSNSLSNEMNLPPPASKDISSYKTKKVKIKDVKAGDYVLSLDESTGKLVPRKVNALLDHGIKPIYEMATEDGRAINTTAEHPYFVKRKVLRDLMGDDLNLPSSSNSIKNPSKSSTLDLSLSNFENDPNSASGLFCGILSQTTENIMEIGDFQDTENHRFSRVLSLGYIQGSVKSSSLVTNTLSSDLESNANLPFEIPFGLKLASYPSDSKNFNNTFFTFSSSRNLSFLKGDCDFDIISSSSEISSIMQSCLDMFLCEGCQETCNYLFNRHSSFNHFQNLPNHDSGTFESRLSMADFTVRDNVLVDFDSHKTNNNNSVFKTFDETPLGEWIEVRYLKIGDEIAVPDYENCAIDNQKENKEVKPLKQVEYISNGIRTDFTETNKHNNYLNFSLLDSRKNATDARAGRAAVSKTAVSDGIRVQTQIYLDENPGGGVPTNSYEGCGIKWVKIASIKQLPSQHVYDLSIEGTRNFIANDIVAHNTYLATSSGKVGIGTASPATVLDVKGKANFTGNFSIMNGSDTIFFVDNTSGKVGIGTAGPGAKLEISGGGAYTAKYRVAHGTANYYWDIGYSDSSLGNYLQFVNRDGAAESTMMVIGLRGNVGINTTAPGSTLTVAGTLNASGSGTGPGLYVNGAGNVGIGTTGPGRMLSLGEKSGQSAVLSFMDTDATELSYIGVARATDDLVTGTTNTDLVIKSYEDTFFLDGTDVNMVIKGTGNVGIGTTSPGRMLEVAGSINGTALNISGPVNLAYGTGNVGIGTTGPYGKLSVAAGTGVTTGLNIASTDAVANGNIAGITFTTVDTISRPRAGIWAVSTPWEATAGWGADLVFATRGAVDATTLQTTDEKMRITTSGNVGIGTTSPGKKLEVVGDVYHNLSTVSQDFNIVNATGDSRFFVDNSNGNVGIGTTSPTFKLDVTGGVHATRGFAVDGNDLQGTYSAGMYGIGTNDATAFLSFTTKGADRVRIDSVGSVGINTTTPEATLEVEGYLCVDDASTAADCSDASAKAPGTIAADGAINANNFDIAEMFYTEDNKSIEPGTIVALSSISIEKEAVKEIYDISESEIDKLSEAYEIDDAEQLIEKIENDTIPLSGIDSAIAEKVEDIKNNLENEQGVTGKDRLLASKSAVVKVSDKAYDSKIIGVISTDPGFLMGFRGGARPGLSVPVAMAGRVPVKVTLENGNIEVGDPLTSSSKPGYAMKAISSGRIIGYALESLDESNEGDKILAFINSGWHQGGSPSTAYSPGNIFYSGAELVEIGIVEAAIEANEPANQTGNMITGGVIEEIIPETDLSNILEPESNATSNESATTATNDTDAEVSNNSINEGITSNETNPEGSENPQLLYGNVQELRHNDFIFRAGTQSNYKELMVINATTGEVKVKKLKADIIEAGNIIGLQQMDYMTKVNGSVIIRLG